MFTVGRINTYCLAYDVIVIYVSGDNLFFFSHIGTAYEKIKNMFFFLLCRKSPIQSSDENQLQYWDDSDYTVREQQQAQNYLIYFYKIVFKATKAIIVINYHMK